MGGCRLIHTEVPRGFLEMNHTNPKDWKGLGIVGKGKKNYYGRGESLGVPQPIKEDWHLEAIEGQKFGFY